MTKSNDSERMAPVPNRARRLGLDLTSLINNRKPSQLTSLIAEVRDFLLEGDWDGSEALRRCWCERCEWKRFEALADRVEKAENSDAECESLVDALHREVRIRHPLGIAERLYDAIGALHAEDADHARDLLDELWKDERSAVEINDEPLAPCKLKKEVS